MGAWLGPDLQGLFQDCPKLLLLLPATWPVAAAGLSVKASQPHLSSYCPTLPDAGLHGSASDLAPRGELGGQAGCKHPGALTEEREEGTAKCSDCISASCQLFFLPLSPF